LKTLEGGKYCTYYAAALEAENLKQLGNGPFLLWNQMLSFITPHSMLTFEPDWDKYIN